MIHKTHVNKLSENSDERNETYIESIILKRERLLEMKPLSSCEPRPSHKLFINSCEDSM